MRYSLAPTEFRTPDRPARNKSLHPLNHLISMSQRGEELPQPQQIHNLPHTECSGVYIQVYHKEAKDCPSHNRYIFHHIQDVLVFTSDFALTSALTWARCTGPPADRRPRGTLLQARHPAASDPVPGLCCAGAQADKEA